MKHYQEGDYLERIADILLRLEKVEAKPRGRVVADMIRKVEECHIRGMKENETIPKKEIYEKIMDLHLRLKRLEAEQHRRGVSINEKNVIAVETWLSKGLKMMVDKVVVEEKSEDENPIFSDIVLYADTKKGENKEKEALMLEDNAENNIVVVTKVQEVQIAEDKSLATEVPLEVVNLKAEMVSSESPVLDCGVDGEEEMKKIDELTNSCDSSHEDVVAENEEEKTKEKELEIFYVDLCTDEVVRKQDEEKENGFFEIHHVVLNCEAEICPLEDIQMLTSVEQHEDKYLEEVPNTQSE